MIQHGAPTMTLTPELIEAAAKLCGWERHNPGSWFIVQWNDNNHIMAGLTTEAHLFPDGLLALEDALLRRGWWHHMLLDLSWHRWVHGKFEYKQAEDRATAACIAAQAELEGK